MNKLRIAFYNLFPQRMKNKMGKSKVLKPFRDLFFRKEGTYREIKSKVRRQYLDYLVEFNFFASIQVAIKAKERGMENTLLRHSIELLLKKRVGDNDYIVFDVGTNFGYLSLVWANSVCKNGKVHSFEPHPSLFKSYKKSIVSNKLQNVISPINAAVGNEKGEIEINILSTTANVLSFNKKEKELKTKVTLLTLDNYIDENKITNCDLIKIDVDGIELDILKGSEKLIKKFKPIIIVETNNDEQIISFFEDHNYKILNMKLDPIKRGELPLNIFCIPN